MKACPHDNVGLLPVLPAAELWRDPPRSSVGRFAKRPDLAALALVLLGGALAAAAAMVAPFEAGISSSGLRAAVFFAVALAATASLAGAASALGRAWARVSASFAEVFRRQAMTLVPLALAIWAAHFLYHLATAGPSVVPVLFRALALPAEAGAGSFVGGATVLRNRDPRSRLRPASHALRRVAARGRALAREASASFCAARVRRVGALGGRRLGPAAAHGDAGDAALIRRRIVLLACAGVFACAGAASADGGRLRSYGDAGDFRVAIFTRPEPLSAGPADVSILVQDRESGEPVLDAEVTLELSGPGGFAAAVPAGRHGRNRLFYGASLDLAPGAWSVTARIRRGTAEAEARASFEVGNARSGALAPWPYLALPPLAVTLFAANRGLRRRERDRRNR